jgi:hypothetical protein
MKLLPLDEKHKKKARPTFDDIHSAPFPSFPFTTKATTPHPLWGISFFLYTFQR